ncbi:MAG: TRAP-type C4-dicarboxylate transport system, substrate-binding protein [Myxococcales bacterium]|nr:TRAP-type C4-dicarboxylate transport system, substrate-binding protein [Myxococcales bacterium]
MAILRTQLVVVAIAVAVAGIAHAEPTTLRMGTIAPGGTEWARITRAIAEDLSTRTDGQVLTKWYLGGIAGDELQMAERVRKDQLDGIASGGTLCTRLSPSMRVLRIVGLFQTRDESAYVAGRLKPIFDDEFHKAGFVNLGEVGIGPDLIFSRTPIMSMDDLKKARLWIWELDQVFRASWPLLGVPVVPTRIDDAERAYDEKRVDGFLAVPTAALAFQWSAKARYVSDLRVSFLRSCILMSTRAFDALSLEQRGALLQTAGKGILQLEELGRRQDEQLVGGLFAKQGLTKTAVSEAFRADFFAQARAVREQIAARLVPAALLQRVLSLLADYRAEHRAFQGDSRR